MSKLVPSVGVYHSQAVLSEAVPMEQGFFGSSLSFDWKKLSTGILISDNLRSLYEHIDEIYHHSLVIHTDCRVNCSLKHPEKRRNKSLSYYIYFLGNMNIYLHFPWFLQNEIALAFNILSCRKIGPTQYT